MKVTLISGHALPADHNVTFANVSLVCGGLDGMQVCIDWLSYGYYF